MNLPNSEKSRIVIVGGGFAGLTLAKNLKHADFQVVLLDKNNYHTFQPLLYQVATAGLEPDSVTYPVRKVFHRYEDFHFRMAEVKEVDTQAKVLKTNKGPLKYDHLVLATGATTNFFGNKGIESLAMPMKSITDALDLRSLLLQNFEEALEASSEEERLELMNVVIVGGGPTGVELAGALAELKTKVLPNDYPDLSIEQMKVVLVQGADRLLPAMSERASARTLKYLEGMGVKVLLKKFVQDYDGHCIYTNDEKIAARTLIWAAGVQGQPVDGVGNIVRGRRIEVDPFFQVIGEEDIYALGDVASMVSDEFPNGHAMMASVACMQAIIMAENFNRMSDGKPPRPYTFKDKGSMATIGKNKAVADLPGIKTSGFVAWMLWMFIHLILLVGFRNRLIALIDWMWSYINYDTGIRLIIRPFRRKTPATAAEGR